MTKEKIGFYKFAPVAIICAIVGVGLHNKSCSSATAKTQETKEIKQVQDTIQNYVQYNQEVRNGR